MDTRFSASGVRPVTDVYTDLHGLQQLGKNEDRNEALKKVAQQFESMFINMMLKNMRQANAVFEKDSPFHSKEGDFYRDMHDHQLSLTLAHKQGFGIADTLYRQLSRSYGNPSNEGSDDNKMTQSKSDNASRVAIADTPQGFINKVMPYIKKAAKALGVDAEILAAQSALETGWGKHMLANNEGNASNNLFNIKKDKNWQGDSVGVNSLEEKNGVLRAQKSEFKAYDSFAESVGDYVNLIKGNQGFKEALTTATNGFDFIQQLQKAGYATDSNYAQKIFSVYKQIKQLDGVE